MKIVTFPEGQGSEDWHEWRKNGLGASDIGVVMGSNHYKTQLSLWEEKCGYRSEDDLNFAIEHGIKNEGVARKWLNENLQLELEPLCVEDNEHSFIRASLDGYDFNKKVLAEIKCPVSHEILNKAREHQSIPLYWLHQLQWQIMICNPIRAFCALWDYRYNSCITVEAFAQPNLQREMIEKGKEFWRMIQVGIPPKPSANDYIEIDDPSLKEILDEYRDHDMVAKAAEFRKKELKTKIVEFGDDGNFMAHGYFITRCAPRITYDIEQMRMDGIDVDSYIKKNNGIGYYKISCPKSS